MSRHNEGLGVGCKDEESKLLRLVLPAAIWIAEGLVGQI